MRKVVVHRAGDHRQLCVEDHPDPRPGPGEVCVATAAVGVNFADCVVRMGLYESAKKYVGWPITPGFEFAGRVQEIGASVDDLAPGDEVFGVTRFGGYATHVVVPRAWLFRRPEHMSVEEAAAFPAVHLTAWYALCELAAPRPGAVLLVHSAAGGVGGALCKLGAIAGSRVIGVVGAPHKEKVARELGAHEVIDKSRVDLWAEAERLAPEGFDAVFDANGVETLAESYGHLAAGGRLVVYGFHSMLRRGAARPSWPKLAVGWLRTPRFNPIAMTGDNRSVMAFNLSYLFDHTDRYQEAMDALLGWLAEGRLRAPPIRSLPLDRVAEAHAALESGTSVGKLVLLTGDG